MSFVHHNTAERRAYVARGLDEFIGYVTDSASESEVYEEGAWSDVEAALGWARERADEVVVRYGFDRGSFFSAGVRRVRRLGEEPLPRWPPNDAVRRAIDETVERDGELRVPADIALLSVVEPMIVRDDDGR